MIRRMTPQPSIRLAFILLSLALLTGISTPHLAAQESSAATFAGVLAYSGCDGNLYLLEGPDSPPVPLTHDAVRGLRSYTWPTWSTDGRLAYFSQEVARLEGEQSILLRIYIREPDATESVLAYESDAETFTYAYWAPANCPIDGDCRDLAVLVSSRQGLGVLRVRDRHPDFDVRRIGLGQPFYYSYAPDASQMLWLRFGTQIEVYDTARERIVERLPDTAGIFQAPMWSPVDNRLLFSVISAEGEHNLVVAEGEDRQIIASNLRGTLWFAWSPNGEYIAYKEDLGPLHVVDSRTGDRVAISSSAPVVAFFWAPDSDKIAYLTLPDRNPEDTQVSLPGTKLAAPARQNGLLSLTWNVLHVTSGIRQSAAQGFVPTREMFYLVAYFDQFAQSHRLWSPDSRYLAYGELTEDSNTFVNVLDTTQPNLPTQQVAEGRIGVWSFHSRDESPSEPE